MLHIISNPQEAEYFYMFDLPLSKCGIRIVMGRQEPRLNSAHIISLPICPTKTPHLKHSTSFDKFWTFSVSHICVKALEDQSPKIGSFGAKYKSQSSLSKILVNKVLLGKQ